MCFLMWIFSLSFLAQARGRGKETVQDAIPGSSWPGSQASSHSRPPPFISLLLPQETLADVPAA